MSLLQVRGLKTWFGTEEGLIKAVDGVDLTLAPGEVVGLVGESGSGKSVTSLSIMGLIPQPPGIPAGGQIAFEGRDLRTLPEPEWAKLRGNRMAMIFQDPMTSLNPFLTVGRQLTEVLERHQGLSQPEAWSRAEAMLTRVGISEAAQRMRAHPHELSGGMRQRVMIAMALLCRPRLLIADEPTTALDVTTQAQILELMRALQRELEMAILLITHDLGVVAGMADRVLVMYAGRVVEAAPALELFEGPRHPYTRGLLSSTPALSGPRARLTPIPGLPPLLSALPPGCPFAPRCSRARPACQEGWPALEEITPGHQVACIDEEARHV